MEGLRGDQDEVQSTEKFGGYKTEVKEIIEGRERQAPRNEVNEEKHLGPELTRNLPNRNSIFR